MDSTTSQRNGSVSNRRAPNILRAELRIVRWALTCSAPRRTAPGLLKGVEIIGCEPHASYGGHPARYGCGLQNRRIPGHCGRAHSDCGRLSGHCLLAARRSLIVGGEASIGCEQRVRLMAVHPTRSRVQDKGAGAGATHGILTSSFLPPAKIREISPHIFAEQSSTARILIDESTATSNTRPNAWL